MLLHDISLHCDILRLLIKLTLNGAQSQILADWN